jgi:isopentenyldiphosphate isomerase
MEYLDIVDEHGNPTGDTVERTLAHKKGIRHRTSHVWIFRSNNGINEILVQKRSLNKDSFPGCYDISSAGHIPAGFGFKESAVRELSEELGIAASENQLELLGQRHFELTNVFHGKEFHDNQVSNVYILKVERSDFKLQESEVESVLWLEFSDFTDKICNSKIPNCVSTEEVQMLSRYFDSLRDEAFNKKF